MSRKGTTTVRQVSVGAAERAVQEGTAGLNSICLISFGKNWSMFVPAKLLMVPPLYLAC